MVYVLQHTLQFQVLISVLLATMSQTTSELVTISSVIVKITKDGGVSLHLMHYNVYILFQTLMTVQMIHVTKEPVWMVSTITLVTADLGLLVVTAVKVNVIVTQVNMIAIQVNI